ncbi:MAG: hypothetical protein ACRCXT_00640 [Paraclostridium sp.]
MKNFTRKKAITQVKKTLKQVEKLGLNIDKITQGKSIEQLAWSNKSYEQFKKQVIRQKQQTKLKEEVKKIDIKIKQRAEQIRIKNQKRQKRNYISKKTQSIMKFNYDEVKPTKTNIKKIVTLKSDDFFKRYFKSTSSNVELSKRVEEISRRFGNRLDLLNDFIDEVTQIDFEYEIDGMVFDKEDFISEQAEDWDDMMESRLNKMFSLLETNKYKI